MMNAFKRKLRSRSGESLGETAASLLVVSFAMLMLAGALVTAGELNKEADDSVGLAAVSGDSSGTPATVTVTMTYDGDSSVVKTAEVDLYDASGLYYYEPKSVGSGS